MKGWKRWLHGLAGATVSGMSTAVGAIIGTVATGDNNVDATQLGGAALGGAIVGAMLYLKQSPVPELEAGRKRRVNADAEK